MYNVYNKSGELMASYTLPPYIKVKPETGAFIEAKQNDAEGLAVNGTVYNLPGQTAIPDAEECVMVWKDHSAIIYQHGLQITENEEAIEVACAELGGAICEIDDTVAMQIDELQAAICELDILSE